MTAKEDKVGPLITWEASDLQIDVMEQHHASTLRQMGILVKERNIFEFFEDPITIAPSVVIMSCIYPPASYRSSLDHLINRCTNHWVDALERRLFYDSISFDA
eukprot:5813076-Pyramimonas_sp.AAC.1